MQLITALNCILWVPLSSSGTSYTLTLRGLTAESRSKLHSPVYLLYSNSKFSANLVVSPQKNYLFRS